MKIKLAVFFVVQIQYIYTLEFAVDHNDHPFARQESNFFEIFSRNKNTGDSRHQDFSTLGRDSKYDFIIVGGGAAGLVLANRLTEVSGWNVLVLEVGEKPPAVTDIPFLAPAFQYTGLNWGYLMEKQEGVGLGLVDQKMAAPRGKVLGGSSVINYLLAVRGNKGDYDDWERMGNPGWGYKDVLKYFIKLENASVPDSDTEVRGHQGYQSIEQPPFRTKSGDVWIEAAEQVGYNYTDYNGRIQIGISRTQGILKNGKRCSTEKAYLRPVEQRKNLRVLTGATVTEILINASTKEAYGVKYLKNGKTYTVTAEKEVICSAGAFNSPQLLMLSGIGPKAHLEELGITVIQDLPVGQKMHDHLAFLGVTYTVNESITLSTTDFINPLTFFEIIQGKGPLTSIFAADDLTYIKVLGGDPTYSDVELIFLNAGFQLDFGTLLRRVFRISDKIYNAVWKPLVGRNVFQVIPFSCHPKSYGYLKLKSKDPSDPPKLYGNFLTDPGNIDMAVTLAAIRVIQKIASMPAMRKYDATLWSVPLPGCEQHKFDSDEYWRCAIRSISASIYHQTNTCKMGPETDPEAVVDPRLRVHGIKRLRVIDSSIFPTITAGHLVIPTIMVAEKGADIIKEDWKV